MARAKKVFDDSEDAYVEMAPQEYARVEPSPEPMKPCLRVDELMRELNDYKALGEYTNVHSVSCVDGVIQCH